MCRFVCVFCLDTSKGKVCQLIAYFVEIKCFNFTYEEEEEEQEEEEEELTPYPLYIPTAPL